MWHGDERRRRTLKRSSRGVDGKGNAACRGVLNIFSLIASMAQEMAAPYARGQKLPDLVHRLDRTSGEPRNGSQCRESGPLARAAEESLRDVAEGIIISPLLSPTTAQRISSRAASHATTKNRTGHQPSAAQADQDTVAAPLDSRKHQIRQELHFARVGLFSLSTRGARSTGHVDSALDHASLVKALSTTTPRGNHALDQPRRPIHASRKFALTTNRRLTSLLPTRRAPSNIWTGAR